MVVVGGMSIFDQGEERLEGVGRGLIGSTVVCLCGRVRDFVGRSVVGGRGDGLGLRGIRGLVPAPLPLTRGSAGSR